MKNLPTPAGHMPIRPTLVPLIAIAVLLGVGDSAEAAWSGGDGTAVFVARRPAGEDGQVALGLRAFIPGRPGSLHQLTSDSSDRAPQISPDGRSIVFERQIATVTPTGSGQSAVFLIDSSGQGLRQLTQPGPTESDSDPTFDASGTRIVFSRRTPTDDGDLYSIELDGNSLRQLTEGAAADGNPAASPSGRQIAFERLFQRSSDSSGRRHIFSMRPDGSRIRDLTAGWRSSELGEPDFAPDGRRIVFTVGYRLSGEIYVMHADGSRPRSITRCREHRKGYVEPAFSPSGGSLLAAAVDKYGSRLTRFRLGKQCPRSNSLSEDFDGGSPAWGPAP